jgi:hypothetical protein
MHVDGLWTLPGDFQAEPCVALPAPVRLYCSVGVLWQLELEATLDASSRSRGSERGQGRWQWTAATLTGAAGELLALGLGSKQPGTLQGIMRLLEWMPTRATCASIHLEDETRF